MIARFFARPETIRLLEDESQAKVLLAGGFSGAWNFGDLMQLQGALRWQQARDSSVILCPVHAYKLSLSLESLRRLEGAFGTRDWILSNEAGDQTQAAISQLGLEPLENGLRGPATLHVYGGGFFNRMWGDSSLDRLEALLLEALPTHYVISGQQVGPEFAPALAAHCRRYRPEIIGCRDRASVDLLLAQGIDARLSGDDALEQMLDAAAPAPSTLSDGHGVTTFALNLNASSYTQAPTEMEDGNGDSLAELKAMTGLLTQRFAPDTTPVLINSYPDERAEIIDTVATSRRVDFAQSFSAYTTLDIVDLFAHGRLAEAVTTVRRCAFALSTSYHVTLFCKVLGVPVFLFAFNDYYRQKKASLGIAESSLANFLSADHRELRAEQNVFVQAQQAVRARWLGALAAALAEPVTESMLLARARASLDYARRLSQTSQAKAADSRMETERATARSRRLEAQLYRLKSSSSWRVTTPLRAASEQWRRLRQVQPRQGRHND